MKLKLIIIIFLLVKAANGQQVLDDYMLEAAEKNVALKAAFAEYHAAMQKVPQAGSLPDPQLAFGYFISPVETRLGAQRFKASVTQKFPWFGVLSKQEDVLTKRAAAKYHVFEQNKNLIFYETAKLWYELYDLSQEREYLDKRLMLIESIKSVILSKNISGKNNQTEILKLKIIEKRALTQKEELSDKETALQSKFNKLLNRESSAEIILTESIPLKKLNQEASTLLDTLLENNSELLVLEAQKQAFKEEEELAELKSFPDVAVGFDYVLITERTDLNPDGNGTDVFMPMISFNIPLDFDRNEARVKEAQYNSQATNFELQNKKNALESQLYAVLAAYSSAERKLELYYISAEDVRQIKILMTADYSAGNATFEELLRTEEELLQYDYLIQKTIAELNLISAQINLLMSKNVIK